VETIDTVRWLQWGAKAFARARAEDRPVLLSIAAPWCQSCLDMDRTTYADPAVARIVNDRFVSTPTSGPTSQNATAWAGGRRRRF
jgi:uncharacterized protein YyaL (SSP411 family)